MADEGRGTCFTVLFSLLAGAAIGSGLALLFTPKNGREMRGQIKDLSDGAVNKIKRYATDAQERIKSTYEVGKELVKEKQTIINSAIKAGKEAMARGSERISEEHDSFESIE